MTSSLDKYTPGGDLAELPDGVMPWDVQGGDTLEELHDNEIPTPRLRIVGKDAQFENQDTSERYDSLDVIILGLARQRIFWGEDVEDGGQPLCRSRDSVHGLPNVDPEVPVKKQFPWRKSNFDRKLLPIAPGTEEQPVAPCVDCIFKEWNDEDDKPGPCAEQLILPVYYRDKSDNWAPAILSFQRSGFKPTTRYLGAIKSSKQPPFRYVTTITLDGRSKGEVVYAVPVYSKGEVTDPGEPDAHGRPENYMNYYNTFEEIKKYLRRAPVRDVAASEENPNHAPSTNVDGGDVVDGDVVDGDVVNDPTTNADVPPAEEPAPADDDDMVF